MRVVESGDSTAELIADQLGLDELSQLHPNTVVAPRRHHRLVGLQSRRRSRVGDFPIRRVPARAWVKRYGAALLTVDLLAGSISAAAAFAIRMPEGAQAQRAAELYLPLAIIFPLCWLAAAWLADAYESKVIGLGSEEYQRIGKAFVGLLAAVGFTSYALHASVPRGYVVIALPAALLLSVFGRFAARKVLHRARLAGRACNSVVVVGDADSVADLTRRMRDEAYAGLKVVGACIPSSELADPRAREELTAVDVPLLGDMDSVLQAVAQSEADTVAVTSSHALGPQRLRELSWQMERIEADLLVAPGLVEVAGPRLHIRPMTGLPLLHVEKPEFAGSRRVMKGAVDRAAALFGLLLISPLLIGVWLTIRLTSSGPAFFRQIRVGKDGKEFTIWKFRSMFTDAEARLAEIETQSDGNGVLFKMKHDPRVTRIGGIIRRFSIDELPQLINVLNGTMSLVGPRPPLPVEVEQYGSDVRRRLLVRPGLTGLWQVSGRSDLSWEESVRLDLRYVENWSLGQDALILWKTASAVLRGSGAY
ncbi:MAG: sugar transferase [Jatrophihabitans sp.]